MEPFDWTGSARRGFAAVSFGQLHYLAAGPANGSDAPVLTLLHQSPSSARMYAELLPVFAQRFRVIAFDTAGFGESDPLPGPPSIERHGDAICEALHSLGIERTHLLGHHTGAAIAVEVAASHSELVDRLVLFGVPDYGDSAGKAARKAQIAAPVLSSDGSHLLSVWQRIRERAPDLDAPLVNRLALEQFRPGTASHLGSVAVVEYDVRPNLARIVAPTMLLAGNRDRFWLESPGVAARIADCKLVELPGATHLVCAEQPAEFAEATMRFLLRQKDQSNVAFDA